MDFFNNKIRNMMLLKYSYTYLILALIIIITLNICTYISLQVLEEKYITANYKSSEQYKNNIEQRIEQAENTTNILLANEARILTLQLLPPTLENTDIYKIWKTNLWLSESFRYNDSNDLYLYFKNNDIFISTSNVYVGFKKIYGSLFQFSDFSYEEFLTFMTAEKHQTKFFSNFQVLLNRKNTKGILFAKAVGNKLYENNVMAYCFIDENFLCQLSSSILTEFHSVSIYDDYGQLLYRIGNEYDETALDNNYIISNAISEKGFRCVTVIHKANAFSEFLYLNNFVLILNILAILFSIVYIMYVSLKNMGKISGVLSELPSYMRPNSGNLFDYLNYSFITLKDNNYNLENMVKKQLPIVKAAVMDKLINGGFTEEKEIEDVLGKIPIDIFRDTYCIILVNFYQNNILSNTLLNHFEAVFTDRGMAYQQGFNTFVVIAGFTKEETSEYKTIIKQALDTFNNAIQDDDKTTCLFCCSNLFESLLDVPQNYNLCRNMLVRTHYKTKDDYLLWYEDIQENPKNHALKKAIEQYINSTFSDPNLSLQSVAANFDFSSNYFSALFKEVMEETFSAYLDRIRLNFADNLICTTDYKVEDIAIKSGYNSSNTFLRAYKRYFGVSPKNRRLFYTNDYILPESDTKS